ncbi:hypothetical protein, partial [Ruminococcus sp. YE71]|uniref:hypothetical protein n=1 Tax=Ruminococcus sp. YE71 TaxID=244362 RepID=UPI001A9A6294
MGTYNAEGQVLSFTNVNSNDVNLISPHEYYLVKKIVVTYEAVSTKTALTTENTTVTMATNSADVASVVVGETTLSATTDYTVSYKQGETDLESAPTEPGTYTAVITGTGDYEGSVEKAFEIKAVTYDITAVKSYGQTVNTDFGSVRTSASGDNYVYYATAKNGYEFLNWTYIVDGIEKTSTNSPLAINYNYAAPTAHFVKASTKTTLTAENTTVTMATNSADVESVVVGETTLTTNDYTVTYQDSQVGTIEKPTEPGTYTAVITGTGNYDGSVTKEFTIPTVVTTIEQLKAAVDEGGTGGLIKLGADITSTSKVDFETASTLDLNGHHLTLKYLNSYTDLVIQDSAENGTLTLTDNGYVIGVYGSNSVTIESGAIEFASIGAEGINIFDDGFVTINGGTVTSAGYSIRRNKGTVTINGGTITGGFYSDGSTNDTLSITGGTFSFDVTSLVAEGVPVEHIGDVWAVGDSIAENTKVVTTIDELKAAVAAGGLIKLGEDIISSNSKVDFKKASTLDLNGHNLTLKYLTARADLVIKDSVGNGKLTIPGGGYAILVCGDISVTIESGAIEFTDTWSYGFKIDTNDGSVTINGGTITSAGYSISRNKGAVTITGGSITGGFDDEFANDTLSITGGTFSFDVTSLLTDGYTATKDGDLWVVGQQTKTSIENATVTMATNSADVASVVVGETTLIEGTDYSVAYKQGETDLDEAPTEVGDYTAVITGLDNYQGTVTKDFSIKTEIDDAVITLGENSSEVKTVVLGETELTEDTDYTVSYEEDGEELEEAPTAPGSYTVIITGTGGYIGTATEDFVIKPDVKDADITLAANSPDVDSVEYDGDEVPDTEYIISYKNLDGDTISKPQVGGTYV